MSITTKLHMILVLLIVAVAVYMFLLYKELRIFERDINILKTQVSSLVLSADAKNTACASPSTMEGHVGDNTVTIPVPVQQVPVVDIEAETNEVDDDDTVTYDEINEIITNIQDEDEEEEDDEEENEEVNIEVPPTLQEDTVIENTVIDDDDVKQSIIRGQMETVERDLSLMDDDALSALKCEELRSFLKTKLGVSVLKGTKQEFIAKIKSMRAE